MAAPYEIYGGNFMLPHPYLAEDVHAFGVSVDADRNALQALVDRTLNCQGRHQNYLVAASRVLVTFMNMGRLRSQGRPNEGHFPERELNVTLLLWSMSSLSFVWYMPHLWIDSGPALIAGRDVYGYPKQLAAW